MRIYDPHAHTAYDMELCHTPEPVDDYVPVQSDYPEHWFAIHMPTGTSHTFDRLDPQTVQLLQDSIRADERDTTETLTEMFGEIPDGLSKGNPLLEAFMDEGVQDKHVLKAIFIAGSGGSGKGTVADAMFSGTGMKVINPDVHLERFMKAAKIPFDEVGSHPGLFYKARVLKNAELRQYAGRRLGLIIDGTGWDYARIADPVKKLRSLGYDVSMVFVKTSLETAIRRNIKRAKKGGRDVPDYAIETAWRGGNKNLKRYLKLFGKQNVHVIDNDADLKPQTWQKIISPRLRKIARKILERPVKNPKGQEWLKNPVPSKNPFTKKEPPARVRDREKESLPTDLWPVGQMALDAVKKAKGRKPKGKSKVAAEPAVRPKSTGIPPKKPFPTGGLPRAADVRKGAK